MENLREMGTGAWWKGLTGEGRKKTEKGICNKQGGKIGKNKAEFWKGILGL